MPVITDIAEAVVRSRVKKLYGTILTKPEQIVSDGINLMYACDVTIGQLDVTGRHDQYKKDLTHLPGQDSWRLSDTMTVNNVLHNVVIARNNANLIYADVGAPVELTRTATGNWQITGFSVEQPGTYWMVPVNLTELTLGSPVDLSLDTRPLTLGELGSVESFGVTPFGARGLYVGGRLLKLL